MDQNVEVEVSSSAATTPPLPPLPPSPFDSFIRGPPKTWSKRSLYNPLMLVNVDELISSWPSYLHNQTFINIEVFAAEEICFEPLDKHEVRTGLRLLQSSDPDHYYGSSNYNVMFKGWHILDRLVARDRFVPVDYIEELRLEVANFSNEEVVLKKGAQLGHLVISLNKY